MKVICIYTLLLLLLLLGCNTKSSEKDHNPDNIQNLYFDKSQAYELPKILPIEQINVTDLVFSDSTLIDRDPILLKDNNDYFVSSNKSQSIMRFDKDGMFINYVSKRGNGPNEYLQINDIYLNEKEKNIIILDNQNLLFLNYDGQFINKRKILYPATSFVIDQKDNYWFYTSNNPLFSHHKLFKTDSLLKKEEPFLPIKNEFALALAEQNFNSSPITTFRESLSNILYIINQDGDLSERYLVDFKELNISSNILLMKDPMMMYEELDKSNYALVRKYFENEKYVFILVVEHLGNSSIQEYYYWIIDKDNKNTKLLKLQENSSNSYQTSPQFISNNNELYSIGYVLGENEEINDIEKNPSIIKIPIQYFFDK